MSLYCGRKINELPVQTALLKRIKERQATPGKFEVKGFAAVIR